MNFPHFKDPLFILRLGNCFDHFLEPFMQFARRGINQFGLWVVLHRVLPNKVNIFLPVFNCQVIMVVEPLCNGSQVHRVADDRAVIGCDFVGHRAQEIERNRQAEELLGDLDAVLVLDFVHFLRLRRKSRSSIGHFQE